MANIAIVTGGTRGIGLAISRRLKEDGYTPVCVYAQDTAAAEACKSQEGFAVYQADIRNKDACMSLVEVVERDLGPVSVLVNNAGVTRDAMFHKMSADDWNEVIQINLGGVFNMSRAVIGGMRARQYGRIVNISSVNGQKGQVGQANYAASKAGLFGLTKALALENATKGITVNAVAPGYVATNMTAAMRPEVLQAIVSQIPVGRLGQPDEIAACVAFLVHPQAGFITGTCLSVNGGQYLAA